MAKCHRIQSSRPAAKIHAQNLVRAVRLVPDVRLDRVRCRRPNWKSIRRHRHRYHFE